MKKNNFYLFDNEIDLGNLIKSIWREKIIVLSISIICSLFGYVYSVSQPKMYKVEIVLRDVPSFIFETYRSFTETEQSQSQGYLGNNFNDEFKLNLLSLDNLVEFAENNNKINDFKNNLKKKNISVGDYFRGKFKLTIDKDKTLSNLNLSKYSLTYAEPLLAETFLNDYIIFTNQKAITIYKKTMTHKIFTKIKLYQQHLKIAESIDLKNPILQSMVEGRGVINEPEALFYKGTKVLLQEIVFLNNLLNETENLTLDYNRILEKTSSELITKSTSIFVSMGLVLGLFFSFIIIFVKKILKS
jgi:LPS O-antigen subunit length determinant protein (WzzB/FepE family)